MAYLSGLGKASYWPPKKIIFEPPIPPGSLRERFRLVAPNAPEALIDAMMVGASRPIVVSRDGFIQWTGPFTAAPDLIGTGWLPMNYHLAMEEPVTGPEIVINSDFIRWHPKYGWIYPNDERVISRIEHGYPDASWTTAGDLAKFAVVAAASAAAVNVAAAAITAASAAETAGAASAAETAGAASAAETAVTAPYVSVAVPVGVPLEPVAAMTAAQGLSTVATEQLAYNAAQAAAETAATAMEPIAVGSAVSTASQLLKTAQIIAPVISSGMKLATQIETAKMLDKMTPTLGLTDLPNTGPNMTLSPAVSAPTKKSLTQYAPYVLFGIGALILLTARPKNASK